MGKRGTWAWEPDWKEFDNLCAIQCSLEEFSAYYHKSEDTIERAVKRAHKMRFADYVRQKRKLGHVSLRRKTWQMALAGDKTMIVILWKKYLGFQDKVYVKEEAPPVEKKEEEAHKLAVEKLEKLLSDFKRAPEADREKNLGLIAARLGIEK